MVLFNPDLEYKGATGIRERDRRQGFLDSFKPAYIFRSLVRQAHHPYDRQKGGMPLSHTILILDATGRVTIHHASACSVQVSLSRPSLIPRELGALTFRYEENMYRIFR